VTPRTGTAKTENELWLDAYNGEVFGEALFGRLAEQAADPTVREKLGILTRLEASTKQLLEPVLDGLGIDRAGADETVANAHSLAAASGSVPWHDLLASFEPNTKQFVAIYEALGELTDREHRPIVELLLAHERALCEYARRELAGDSAAAADAILSLPHVR